MKSFNRTGLALVPGAIAAMLLAGSVNAAPDMNAETGTVSNTQADQYVSYADLKTSSDEGMEALMRRIERAAESVCGSSQYHRAGSARQARENAQCQQDAIAAALSQLPMDKVASIK